jgi:hypothetical protein
MVGFLSAMDYVFLRSLLKTWIDVDFRFALLTGLRRLREDSCGG